MTSSSSSATATQRQTHWVIAIGIGQYPLLPPLPEAETNAVMVARAWQSMAEHQRRCLVLSDRSLPVLERPTYPNRENLEYWLDRLTTELIQPGDTVWCFFSGYGVTHRDHDYLLPIEASLDRVATAGIPLRRICEYLKLASDRVGATGQVLALLDLSRPPQETLPFVGNDLPLLAQEMGLSVVLAEPGAGSTSSGLLAPALVSALDLGQSMNLYALVRFLRDATRDRAQQLGQVPPQIQVFAHPHERLYATVLGRSRPELPLNQGAFVVFPASPVELQEAAESVPALEPTWEPSLAAITPIASLGSSSEPPVAINANPDLDRWTDEALDRFAAEAESPAAPNTWAAEPSIFEPVFAAAAQPATDPIRSPQPTNPVGLSLLSLKAFPEPTPEPIPELRRDLASPPPAPPIVNSVLSASDRRFARQLVLWGGGIGIALLAATIARNYAALFGSGWSGSQPAPQAIVTPLPAPTNGAAPPTGSAIAPSPATAPAAPATPAATTPAATPIATIATPTTTPAAPTANGNPVNGNPANGNPADSDPAKIAQFVQAARSEVAVGQFQRALNWLDKVPPNAQTSEIQKLRADATQGRDRNLLGLARIPIGTNQASEFGKAILQARKIKAGDPGYAQAQEAIDRWSRVILDLAKGRAQNGDFGGAIAAAKIVAADRGETYKEARAAIGQWQTLQQQQANNRVILQKAASQIQGGQASSYNRAIDLVRVIPATQPGFEAARDQINLWSQEIMNLARTRANGKQWAAAIQTAKLVPPGTAAHASAQQAIAQWQKQPR